jgi:hypothetical protein
MAVDYTEQLIKDISSLKEKKNAIILAHNYVLGEVQDIADFVGDSLELSKRAAEVTEDVIVAAAGGNRIRTRPADHPVGAFTNNDDVVLLRRLANVLDIVG